MPRPLKVLLLLSFFALCAAAILTTRFAGQQKPPEARELFSVVNRQLSALRASDFGSAYRHAAIGIRRRFSQTEFETMIRRDFSPMTQAAEVEFGGIRLAGATAMAQVFLTDPDGSVHIFLYTFTAEADGWKIAGVQSLGIKPAGRLPGMHV